MSDGAEVLLWVYPHLTVKGRVEIGAGYESARAWMREHSESLLACAREAFAAFRQRPPSPKNLVSLAVEITDALKRAGHERVTVLAATVKVERRPEGHELLTYEAL